MRPPDSPDPLDSLLDAWPDAARSIADLTPKVWRRIAQLEAQPAPESASLWGRVDAWLSRPASAVLFVTSCALLGLFLAAVRVDRDQRAHSAQLIQSYVQLIDPLLKPATDAKSS